MNKLVSVIIPTFNEEKLIGKCIDSLLVQTYKPIEIILIDDGSSDRTLEVLSNFKFQISNFKLLKQSHQGPATARNLGVKNSAGEVLCFLDADMTFEKDFIEKLVKPILEGKEKGTFSSDENIGNWDNVWSRCWNYNQGWSEGKMHHKNVQASDFRAILKSEFEKVGGFDKGGYTDTWSLPKKLKYYPVDVKKAKFYHYNPDNLLEVFTQSKWSAKREYKLGKIGELLTLGNVSLPISLIVGIYKSLKYQEIRFLVFKVIYDFGAFVGLLEKIFGGNLSK